MRLNASRCFIAAALSATALAGTSQALASMLLAALPAKMAIDALLIWPAMKHFNKRHLWRYFIPGQLLYPVYSSLSVPAGRLSGFTWKNRRYHVN